MSQLSGMTGFARAEGRQGDWNWTWEVRSVNGKGLDLRLRLPQGYDAIESALRDIARTAFTRGSIQAGLTISRDETAGSAAIDEKRLSALIEASVPWVAAGKVSPPHFDGLLQIKGVLKADDEIDADDRAGIERGLLTSFDTAVRALKQAREDEGRALAEILLRQVDEIESLAADAADTASVRIETIRDRLAQRIADLIGSDFPEERLAQEVAVLALKADVREELDRLGAHITTARDLIAAGSPAGRKLDFLSQEFNREANTLCSKSGDSDLTRIGLALKTVIDQFREQVQNVE
ncbi:MAG: YicC family protein [Maricaulis sp.]|nr:YicC family protein [Maricaulis sp.]HAQ35539.1 YicC family protein [Alphaproteobacteria bacterium]